MKTIISIALLVLVAQSSFISQTLAYRDASSCITDLSGAVETLQEVMNQVTSGDMNINTLKTELEQFISDVQSASQDCGMTNSIHYNVEDVAGCLSDLESLVTVGESLYSDLTASKVDFTKILTDGQAFVSGAEKAYTECQQSQFDEFPALFQNNTPTPPPPPGHHNCSDLKNETERKTCEYCQKNPNDKKCEKRPPGPPHNEYSSQKNDTPQPPPPPGHHNCSDLKNETERKTCEYCQKNPNDKKCEKRPPGPPKSYSYDFSDNKPEPSPEDDCSKLPEKYQKICEYCQKNPDDDKCGEKKKPQHLKSFLESILQWM